MAPAGDIRDPLGTCPVFLLFFFCLFFVCVCVCVFFFFVFVFFLLKSKVAQETICMNCQSLFSGNNKKNIVRLSSTEGA